jgi:hypothetical protein
MTLSNGASVLDCFCAAMASEGGSGRSSSGWLAPSSACTAIIVSSLAALQNSVSLMLVGAEFCSQLWLTYRLMPRIAPGVPCYGQVGKKWSRRSCRRIPLANTLPALSHQRLKPPQFPAAILIPRKAKSRSFQELAPSAPDISFCRLASPSTTMRVVLNLMDARDGLHIPGSAVQLTVAPLFPVNPRLI